MVDEQKGSSVPYLERKIGAHEYEAYRLTLSDWMALSEHLASVLGKPFAAALRAGSVDMGVVLQADVMAIAVASIMERLTQSNMERLLDFAQKSIRFPGGAGWKIETHHMHWQRYMAEFAPAMALFLEAQYADFFDGLKGSLPQRKNGPEDQEASTDPGYTESPST